MSRAFIIVLVSVMFMAGRAGAESREIVMHPGVGSVLVTEHWSAGSEKALPAEMVLTVDGTVMWFTDGILIGLDEDVGISEIWESLRALGIESERTLGGTPGHHRLVVATGEDPLIVSEKVRLIEGVRWCHPDFALTLEPTATFPDDPLFGEQWHLHNTALYDGQVEDADVDCPEAWDIATGEGIVVAVLDSGVDLTHEDLVCTEGWDYVDDDDDASPDVDMESYEHGTAVAGVAAATGDNGLGVTGSSLGARVMPIRLLGETTNLGHVYDSFIWAVDHGADVLNNSWSFSARECPNVPGYGAIWDAVEYATDNGRDGLGTIVVFGVGNGHCDIQNDGVLAIPMIFVVGASDDRDLHCGYSNTGRWLDVVAPSGVGERQYIRTTDVMGEYGYSSEYAEGNYTDGFSGTSSSTPLVSGVFALMMQANPRADAATLMEVMRQTADEIDEPGGDYDADGHSALYGHGRVNAYAAVEAIANTEPPVVTTLWPMGELEWTGDLIAFEFEAEDSDGDDLTFDLWLYGPGGEDDIVATRLSTRPPVNLVVEAGEGYTWQVRAVDAWGPGPICDPVEFSLVMPPEPEPEEQIEEISDGVADADTDDEGPSGGCGCIVVW